MSSSNSSDNGKSCVKDGLSSLPVSSSKDEQHSISKEKISVLRFTPPQIHKVHKRRKCDSLASSSLKRRSNNIPIEALETSELKDKLGESPIKNSSTSERVRSSDISTKSSLSKIESPRSTYSQDTDSVLETYKSRNEYGQSQTPTKDRSSVSSRKLNLSASESCSSLQKCEQYSDSDSFIDESQNSSAYFTPEGTPLSVKSKEAKEGQHFRFKRSLSDEYNEECNSANSSLNSSGYYTPESSPFKFNPAKRQRTRWSDSSSFTLDNSSYSSWRTKTDSSDQGIQPELIGYQMVGDSQFCRFGQQLLGLERVPMPNSPGRIGICVSGQTITDLHRRVKDNFYPISDKIILMIGTNDFLRNVNVTTMCQELSALIKTLQKSASNIILLTLPPIPKLEKKSSMTHFKLLDVYNSHIRSLENGENLRIADISPMYMTSPPYQRCRMHLFEVFFNGPAKRLDLIHLNRCGLDLIRNYILEKFL